MKSFAKLVVFVLLTILALVVFVGSGIGQSLFGLNLESSSVGITTSEIITKLIEVGVALFTSWLTTSAFAKTPWMKALIAAITPLFNPTVEKSSEQVFQEDVTKLLLHAISKKDAIMTTLLCEQLAGEPFLSEPESEEPQTFPSV